MLWLLCLLGFGAVVTGPLFSMDASGQLGKALVYTKWKGRSVVREYVVPSNPRSLAQRAQRALVKITNLIWANADETDKSSWTDLAVAGNYSTFNGFTSFNLDAMGGGAYPTKDRSDTPTVPSGALNGATGTGGVNRIDVVIDVDLSSATDLILLSIVEGSSAPGKTLNAVVDAAYCNVGTTFTIDNLPAGTYSISAWVISPTGEEESGSSVDDTAIVVTGT